MFIRKLRTTAARLRKELGADMAGKEFLGRGMKFPPQINKATGRFVVSDGERSVKESIYIILMTQRSERWIHPEFGSRLMSYTFMDISSTRLHMLARELKETLLTQEPRLAEVDVNVEARLDKGCLLATIQYRVAEGYTQDSLVFPFYLDAGTEGIADGR